jgi:putative endonuclease
MKRLYVYILASQKNGTLYASVTNDISRRAWEHRTGAAPGFTKRHSVKRLGYLEEAPTAEAAIRREKAIKSWSRQWKINLVERDNPEWFDLYRRLNR